MVCPLRPSSPGLWFVILATVLAGLKNRDGLYSAWDAYHSTCQYLQAETVSENSHKFKVILLLQPCGVPAGWVTYSSPYCTDASLSKDVRGKEV